MNRSLKLPEPVHRSPLDLWQDAIAWVGDTGWPTRLQDLALADDVYARWIAATDAKWTNNHCRDFDLLAVLLGEALAESHDDTAIGYLQILLTLDLTLRARREGRLGAAFTH